MPVNLIPQSIQRVAGKRLEVLAATEGLRNLRIPLSNGLEKLLGARRGQHSIRTNDQWRICFEWQSGGYPCEGMFKELLMVNLVCDER